MGLKIAFIGQKGFPATWGGVERHVEQLALGLAARGHEITVYSRPWYAPSSNGHHPGIRVRSLPSIRTKHLDTISHTLLSSLDSLFRDYDIVHYHALGPASLSWMPRLRRSRVVVTIHRFDYMAEKWGILARRFLRVGEATAFISAHRVVVVSPDQEAVYASQGRSSEFIPHGIPIPSPAGSSLLEERLGVGPGKYVLFLGRLVPEKRPEMLVRAFRRLEPTDWRLVVAGGSSSTDAFVRALQETAARDPRIVFPGFLSGPLLHEAIAHAGLLVLPSSLEGFPLVLLEAMSYGTLCLASDITPHRLLIRPHENGLLFRSGDEDSLLASLREALDPTFRARNLATISSEARNTILKGFSPDHALIRTEDLYQRALGRS